MARAVGVVTGVPGAGDDLLAGRGWLVVESDAFTPAGTVAAIVAAFGGSA